MNFKNIPTFIYHKGGTHERAAWIVLANTTADTLGNVAVHRHDVASFDNYISESNSNKRFDSVRPGAKIIKDELTSFDLEFINSYVTTYNVMEQDTTITFMINKYGQFEHEEQVSDDKGTSLRGFKIPPKKVK